MKILPEAICLDYKFICPDCEDSIWVTDAIGLPEDFPVRCRCGFQATICSEPTRHYLTEAPRTITKKQQPKINIDPSIISILIAQGFKKEKIAKIIQTIPQDLPRDELITTIINKYE